MPKITSRPPSVLYAAGWDRIFGHAGWTEADLRAHGVPKVLAKLEILRRQMEYGPKDKGHAPPRAR